MKTYVSTNMCIILTVSFQDMFSMPSGSWQRPCSTNVDGQSWLKMELFPITLQLQITSSMFWLVGTCWTLVGHWSSLFFSVLYPVFVSHIEQYTLNRIQWCRSVVSVWQNYSHAWHKVQRGKFSCCGMVVIDKWLMVYSAYSAYYTRQSWRWVRKELLWLSTSRQNWLSAIVLMPLHMEPLLCSVLFKLNN